MNTSYAFYFDSRFCSGCKACQAACKDKNNLPASVLWRRVYEISGGTWQQNGDAWNNTVFAYNLSMSCNHCIHPKCAGVCPVDAYIVHENGVVILDTTRCVGCGYCAWACPYGAPQYNPDTGTMTKCDFCIDHLEQGLPPACVAACPLRVLNYREPQSGQGMALWDVPAETHPFPLSLYSRTQPRLAIQPHAAINTMEKKSIANLEEIQPRASSNWHELPLMLFTLLGQTAAGGFWSILWMFPLLWSLVEFDSTMLRLLPSLAIGACLAVAALSSFAHLGTKKNAWRVLSHLRRSWLSREILFTGLFGAGWLFTTCEILLYRVNIVSMGITATLGLGLVNSMAQVYRIPAAPGWNSWRTNVSFMVSALLLGQSLMASFVVYESNLTGILLPPIQKIITSSGIILLLSIQILLMPKRNEVASLMNIRIGLMLAGMVLATSSLISPAAYSFWFSLMIFLTIVAEESLGRWLFYQNRT